MAVLIEGLPPTALSKQDNPGEVPWGVTDELLAQLVEEVSVLTSDRRRKEPIEIPRPGRESRTQQKAAQPILTGNAQTGLTAHGLSGMLAAAQVYGAVRHD